jgi:hypothetical protein
LFAAINGLITSCCFGGRWTPFFIAKNTLVFTLFVQRVFSFLLLRLAFVFCLDFFQIFFYLCIKVYFDHCIKHLPITIQGVSGVYNNKARE